MVLNELSSPHQAWLPAAKRIQHFYLILSLQKKMPIPPFLGILRSMQNLRGHEYGIVRITVSAAISPLISLKTYLLEAGIATAESLIELGAVYVNERRTDKPETLLKPHDKVRAHTQPRRYKRPYGLKERILQQTQDYIIYDKPAGLPVHSQVDNQKENLLSFLEEEFKVPLFITHRLDTETSGCLLIAKTREAQSEINLRFREKTILKNYVAEVEAAVSLGKYIHFMKPSFTSPKEVTLQETEGSLRCELIIQDRKALSNGRFELFIELLTGRPQQIRAQLTALGAPIIGDAKYGSSIKLAGDSPAIALRCSRLEFYTAFETKSFT